MSMKKFLQFMLVAAILGAGGVTVFFSQGNTTPPELILQTGHTRLVEAVVFGPDDRWLASASFDSTIKIWETETGRELRSLIGHTGAVKALATSHDGFLLASGGNDKTLRTWDVKSGKPLGAFPIDTTIESVVFSPDGKFIAAAGSAGWVTLRVTVTGHELARLSGHNGTILSLSFSPDGEFIASGGSDKNVTIWNVETRSQVRTLKGFLQPVEALRFSPDGSILATGGEAVKLWRTANGREIATTAKIGGNPLAFIFSSTDKLLSADSQRGVATYNIDAKGSSSAIAKLAANVAGEGRSAAFSSDGARYAVGNGDGTITLIDTKKNAVAATLENHLAGTYGVAFSSDGHWLASGSFDNSVKLWDLHTGESLRPLTGHTGRVRNVVFHPDNMRIISGSADHTIRIWDAVFGKPLKVLKGHTGSVSSVAVGGKGNLIVSGGMDQTVGIWDVATGTPRFLKGHIGEVIAVAIDRDEKLIVSTGNDGSIRIWDIASGSVIRTISASSVEVGALAISPDGKIVASAGADKLVKLWETETGRLMRELPGHSAKINSVSFSPDGSQLASAGQDRNIRTWRVSDGGEIVSSTTHLGTVFGVGYSGDGKFIASASEDGSVSIWNSATGSRTATLLSMKNSNDWLVVSPKGFFDGSPPSWEQLAWRFENDSFNVRSVEVFFSEFFVPGLLHELLNDRAMPSSSNISAKDRRQPTVKLSTETAGPHAVNATVNISNALAGAKDVRLFRNGVLVKVWRGDIALSNAVASLSTQIPLVAGENRLTAYAFNSDDVKSTNAETIVVGSSEVARKGVSYIVGIGVNEYANADYNLNVAVADARDFTAEMKRQQQRLGQYDRIETFMLADKDATKANITTLLSELSKKIRPEDWVTIFFAGHGIAKDKRFYLVPHDLGYSGSRSQLAAADLQAILDHSISDDELDVISERIDARHFLLVIDACNSGQVLESDEKRRGPMNSKGLAHLAYEKGMYILTASQSYQDAKEDARLGHGYLTYALVEEGLKTAVADRMPKDGQILLREWLDFATVRVPEIDQEEVNKGRKKARQLEREKAKAAGRPLDEFTLQRPRVFYRREAEAQPIVISRY